MLSRKKKREKSDHSSFQKKNVQQKMNQIFCLLIIFASFTFGTNYVLAKENEDILKVYHIYSGNEYIGRLANVDQIERLKIEKLEKAKDEYDDFSLNIKDELSIIPERVFNAQIDDKQVIKKIDELLTVEVEAIGIQIDEKTIVYVKDQKSYDQVIRELKLQVVKKEELEAFEKMKDMDSIPALKENETRIVDLKMTKDLKAVEEKATPEKVLTIKEAVEFLNKGTLEEKTYTVKSGDVLGSIANKHGMKTTELIKLNEGFTEDTVLQLEDELNVTVSKPLVEIEAQYETKKKETIPYKKVTKNDETSHKGDKKITQNGSNGEKVMTEVVHKKNGQIISKSIKDEKILREPQDEVTVVGTKVLASRGTGSFAWPTSGGYVSSQMGTRWGRMHRGIDIARPSARSIFAADSGVVVSAGNDGSYGNKIVIDHKNGYRTLYAHLSAIHVSVGQTVPRGTTIGIMGSTGRSTGVHLHFEVTKNGTLLNPLSVLK